MKKNLIALAVAGALVAPVAMAEVTVSGGLQAELVQVGGNGSTPNGLYANDAMEVGAQNSGNYGFLKFAASEDLGGGMKALAVYNLNAHVGDETNAVGTRDAFVGLSTGFGTVLAGTLSTPYKTSTVNYDPMLATSFQARGNYGMSGLHNGYVGNALAYANSFGGGMVKLVAALVLDETANTAATPTDKTTGQHAKSLSVNIAPMSGLDVAIAYISMDKFGNVDSTPATENAKKAATKVGAKYTMGAITLAAQVEMLDKGATNSGDKGNVTYVTGSFKMDDANSISVAFGQTDKKANSTAAQILAGTDDAATYMAVGFNHAFSKSTSATIGYRASDNKAGAGAKETAVGAGLRVNF